MRLFAKVAVVRIGDPSDRSRLASRIGTEGDHGTWAIDRQRTQKKSVCQTKDGAIGADTESESQCCDQREPWRFGQHAHAVADVLVKRFHNTFFLSFRALRG